MPAGAGLGQCTCKRRTLTTLLRASVSPAGVSVRQAAPAAADGGAAGAHGLERRAGQPYPVCHGERHVQRENGCAVF
jgi:hypothetical protein